MKYEAVTIIYSPLTISSTVHTSIIGMRAVCGLRVVVTAQQSGFSTDTVCVVIIDGSSSSRECGYREYHRVCRRIYTMTCKFIALFVEFLLIILF